MLIKILASIIVVSLALGFVCGAVECIIDVIRRAKLEERKTKAIEKIADKCDHEETK